MVACFGDDCATVGMPDEHGLVGLLVERAVRHRYVVGERGRRVLHDGDRVAVSPQDAVDARPTGAVDEAAMDENDIRHEIVPSVRRHVSHAFGEATSVAGRVAPYDRRTVNAAVVDPLRAPRRRVVVRGEPGSWRCTMAAVME